MVLNHTAVSRNNQCHGIAGMPFDVLKSVTNKNFLVISKKDFTTPAAGTAPVTLRIAVYGETAVDAVAHGQVVFLIFHGVGHFPPYTAQQTAFVFLSFPERFDDTEHAFVWLGPFPFLCDV